MKLTEPTQAHILLSLSVSAVIFLDCVFYLNSRLSFEQKLKQKEVELLQQKVVGTIKTVES